MRLGRSARAGPYRRRQSGADAPRYDQQPTPRDPQKLGRLQEDPTPSRHVGIDVGKPHDQEAA